MIVERSMGMKKRWKLIGIVGLVVVLVITGFQQSLSDPLEDNVEVEPESELTYYLNVKYDGVDKDGVESSDTVVASINSDTIYVEDKIPDGLTFNGFVGTEDGSIGAVRRDDETTSCLGAVVDDTDGTETLNSYHGLHYDEATRTVSFKVRNLQAGCVLTVGIKTLTPTIDDPNTVEEETRRDFYNYATAREGSQTATSNTVHVWMGSETVGMYSVSYEYDGEIPEGAPELPTSTSYATGVNVNVASDPVLEGYTFSGWSSSGVTVNNGAFTMPGEPVVFTGSFTKKDGYTVRYEITGEIPENYVVPSEKEYFAGDTVRVDSTESGYVFNGYRFSGWSSSNIEIDENGEFIMPSGDIVITGSFEEVTYTVTYEYYDTVVPVDSSGDPIDPPEAQVYRPGDIVTLPDVSDVAGYKFLGWYKEDNFEMPEEDITIYGEWQKVSGLFSPTITKEVIDVTDYYIPGDIVVYEIRIRNNADYPIYDVIIRENGENSYFLDNGEEVKTIVIDEIESYHTETVFSYHTVTDEESGVIENEVEILGALADDDNYLDTSKEYKATDTINIASPLEICKMNSQLGNSEDSFQFKITGPSYETYMVLKNNECGKMYLTPGRYTISEIAKQDYTLESVSGAISSNGSMLDVEFDQSYRIEFTNRYNRLGYFHSYGSIRNVIERAANNG